LLCNKVDKWYYTYYIIEILEIEIRALLLI